MKSSQKLTQDIKRINYYILLTVLLAYPAGAFVPRCSFVISQKYLKETAKYEQSTLLQMIYAPPGSGYAQPEDEKSDLPDTYEPMMEYPGTMRPGRTLENMPFCDLPIGDDDPTPVPWPHFQELEWHHQWDPPHKAPIEMEQFIEMNGRWATPEMEAAMRAGVRRDVRERQEQADQDRRDMVITDDDEDDEGSDEPVSLGDGMFGKLGSADDEALTREAVRPREEGEEEDEEEDDEGTEDDDLDNFLLDLGLDMSDDADDSEGTDSESPPTRKSSKASLDEDDDDDSSSTIDMVSDGGEVTATINVDDDEDMDIGLDEDEDMDDVEVPLEDFDSDNLDSEDVFDDGGFDFDDGDFGGGDDDW